MWATAFTILGLIAYTAIDRTGDFLAPLLGGLSRPYGRGGLLFTAAYLLGATVLLVGAWRFAPSRRARGLLVPAAVVGLAILVRSVTAVLADAPLTGENRIVNSQAVDILEGACCFGHRPTGYPIALSMAFRLFGVGPTAIESLNIAFAAATTWLVWDIGRISWSRRVGAFAATSYALAPSAILMTLVPLTEPMYTLLVVAAVRAGIVLSGGWVGPVVVTAAVLAMGQYVRATAAALLLPMIVLPFLAGWRVARTIARGGIVTGVFVVLLVPVIAYNVETHGDLSISTSAYGGWSLYVGANLESAGRWNPEDAARFASFRGETAWEKSKYAGTLAWDRIMEDPGASLGRLLPRKFELLWSDETYAAGYALPVTATRGPTREMWVGWLTSQLFWVPLTLMAAAGMFFERREPRPATLLIGMIVVIVAASHAVLEVHGRYHAYVVPLLCLIGAVGVSGVAGRLRWRLTATRATV